MTARYAAAWPSFSDQWPNNIGLQNCGRTFNDQFFNEIKDQNKKNRSIDPGSERHSRRPTKELGGQLPP